jgi:hypothetical protein
VIPTYPDDSVQSYVTPWWQKDQGRELTRGRLLWAFLPLVDHQQYVLVPIGRQTPEEHRTANFRVEVLDVRNPPRGVEDLPVAALPNHPGSVRALYMAKRRPALVIATPGLGVERRFRKGFPTYQTAKTMLVAPYYGADRDGTRAGWPPALVQRIRWGEYPQYICDKLPLPGSQESILRLDQIQPLGSDPTVFDLTDYRLTDDALGIMDDWITWHFYGGIPEGSFLAEVRKALLAEESRDG